MADLFTRVIPVEGAYNVRDLGGYPTRYGGTTRWRRFFRADSLHALTRGAQQQLYDAGVRLVIDLRSHQEAARAVNPLSGWAGVAYLHLPIYEDDVSDNPQLLESPEPFVTLYRRMLDERQPQFRAVMGAIAQSDQAGLLFHCTLGKDRTGVTAALLLALAGVSHENIAADYALTADCIQGIVARYRQAALAQGISGDVFDRLIASDPDDMRGTLAHLERVYGGAEAYLTQIGLERDAIDRLRRRLLQPDDGIAAQDES